MSTELLIFLIVLDSVMIYFNYRFGNRLWAGVFIGFLIKNVTFYIGGLL